MKTNLIEQELNELAMSLGKLDVTDEKYKVTLERIKELNYILSQQEKINYDFEANGRDNERLEIEMNREKSQKRHNRIKLVLEGLAVIVPAATTLGIANGFLKAEQIGKIVPNDLMRLIKVSPKK